LDRAAVHALTSAALEVVVHVRREAAGRRVAAIGVVERHAGGGVQVTAGWRVDGGPAPAADRLAGLLGTPG
jgi:pilus assembly protein CpaF